MLPSSAGRQARVADLSSHAHQGPTISLSLSYLPSCVLRVLVTVTSQSDIAFCSPNRSVEPEPADHMLAMPIVASCAGGAGDK